jgi:hypothetical protein
MIRPFAEYIWPEIPIDMFGGVAKEIGYTGIDWVVEGSSFRVFEGISLYTQLKEKPYLYVWLNGRQHPIASVGKMLPSFNRSMVQ